MLRAESCLACAALMLLACGPREKPQERKSWKPTNVVVVTVDTLRPDHLRCYGYGKIDTPAIDGLAASGTLFENAVAQTPLTPPSHASIFTGQYPTVHGVRNTGGFILQSSARPLARILQEQGWDTAAFVSSAVLKKAFGFNNGFATYDDEMPKPVKGVDTREDPERRGGETVDRAIGWLEKQTGKPYLLWVHLYDPHLPYDPPGEFRQKYRDAPYDGEIAYADQQIGRLLDTVRKKPGGEQTIVALLSDHGESLGEHGEYTHGIFLYDSTLRIAFVLAGPGIPAGTRVKQQVRSVDFLPTILNALNGVTPANVQGANLQPTFAKRAAETDISYGETLYPKLSMAWSELRAIRTNRWKYVRAPRPELYDLTADPHEAKNVIDEHPDQAAKFEAQLNHIAPVTEKVETNLVDQRLMDQLRSLGYLSGFAARTYELSGKGADPKDRVGILKLLYLAEEAPGPITEQRRTALLTEALRQDPMSPSLYQQLGSELEKTGQQEKAIALYRSALQKGVENGRLHSRIADLSLRKGDKETAITEYEKAAQFNPSDLESQTNLGTAYLEKGRVADAERVFHWVLTTDLQSAAANNGLGLVAIQKHDAAGAQTYFEKAAQLDPELAEAQMNLGLLYEMAGDRARAKAAFEAFLAKASQAQYGELIPKVKQEIANLQ